MRLADDVVLHVGEDFTGDTTGARTPALTDTLGRALSHSGDQRWTGVHVRHDEQAEHLDLWLATTGGIPFGRISAGAQSRSLGLPAPAVRWAGAAVYDTGALAYLIGRAAGSDAEELGVAGYEPKATHLADRLAQLLRRWSTTRQLQPAFTAWLDHHDHHAGQATLVRPETSLTIAWR